MFRRSIFTTTSALAVLCCISLMPRQSRADLTSAMNCVDPRTGEEIPKVFEPNVPGVAVSTHDQAGRPIIVMSSELQQMPPKFELFVFLHECGHHALGHLLTRSNPYDIRNNWQKEEDADCYALQHMYQKTTVTMQDLNTIANFFWDDPITKGHPDGQTRVQAMVNCINQNHLMGLLIN